MELHDHIGVFPNAVPDDLCDAIIESFHAWQEKRYEPGQELTFGDGEKQFGAMGAAGRKDVQFYLEAVDSPLTMQLNSFIGKCFEEYATVYTGLVQEQDPVSSWTCKVQKTSAGGGYHVWHCENGVFIYRDRVLTWMIYLNDIPVGNGGATEFLYQKVALQPKKGTVVLWPATYTHMHRGGFLTGDVDKYIATGWFLREPGQKTEVELSKRL